MEVRDMLSAQYAQQMALIGAIPEDALERRALVADFTTALMDEAMGYLNSTGYKRFFEREALPRSTRVEELLDTIKYALALCWLEGVTAAEFEDLFEAKTRWAYERHRRVELGNRVASFDVDGVLADDLPWAEARSDAEFIEMGGCLQLTPRAGAVELLSALRAAGYQIVITTARKSWLYRRLERDTADWLAANELPYDKLIFGYDKMERLKQFGASIRFHVEDSPKHALDVAAGGVRVYFIQSRSGTCPLHPGIISVQTLGEILERENAC